MCMLAHQEAWSPHQTKEVYLADRASFVATVDPASADLYIPDVQKVEKSSR